MQINSSRTKILLYLLLLGFFALLAKAFSVQIVQASFLKNEGNKRQIRNLEVQAPRGEIFDRNGKLLALSTPIASIVVNPSEIYQTPEVVASLARVLGLSAPGLQQHLESNSKRKHMYIKRWVTPDLAAKVEALNLPFVSIDAEFKRYYPAGSTSSHLVGFTNIDDVGQDGVEYLHNSWLRGESGVRQIVKDQSGRVVRFVKDVREAKQGKPLHLSLDKDLQYFTQKALKEAMAKHEAIGAAAVILDAKTGEILALSSEPSFNPNDRTQLQGEALRNRVIASLIEPGSTLKPFIVAQALHTGVIEPDIEIDTNPRLIIQGNNISDAAPYGVLDLAGILQKSSNKGIVKVAQKLPSEDQWYGLNDLGFAQDSGLFLPGEQAGNLKYFSEWMESDKASISYGYSLNINLLQLARAYMIFTNEGFLPPVSLLKLDTEPQKTRVVSEQAAQQVLAMLETVTQKGGTATSAQVEGYRVAGKTGTVRKTKVGGYQEDKHMATFVGIAPVSQPDMIMAIMVDEPNRGVYGGGAVAAPIFAQVMQDALRLRNVAPDGGQ